jgi:signal peptidase I
VIDLIREALERFGEARLRVTGSSMLPSIRPGDMVTIERRTLSEVRRGDVALFTHDDRLFAHRVIARDDDRLVTQGDSVPSIDAPVNAGDLLGVVVAVSRNGQAVRGFINPGLRARLVSIVAARSSHLNKVVQRLHSMCSFGSSAAVAS